MNKVVHIFMSELFPLEMYDIRISAYGLYCSPGDRLQNDFPGRKYACALIFRVFIFPDMCQCLILHIADQISNGESEVNIPI